MRAATPRSPGAAPSNDFRLVTLGSLALLSPEGAEDASLATRRLKLALLVVLAVSHRPLSRDYLIGMFWGDQEEERARHSLSDALSHLRRALGREAITVRQAAVALSDEARLTVDAVEFSEAVTGKEFERAIALYGGPFLDGVFVAGSRQFDEWVDRERTRLTALFVRACETQCAALARARRWEECAALALRWLDAAPVSTDAALYRLNALKAPATRDADQRALDEYARIAALLDREFDRSPDRTVAALARDIAERLAASDATGEFPTPGVSRGAPTPTGREKAAPPPGATGPGATARVMAPPPPSTARSPTSDAAPGPVAHPPAAEVDLTGEWPWGVAGGRSAQPWRRARRRLMWMAAGAAMLVGAVALATSVRRALSRQAVPAVPTVAVVGIRDLRGDTASAWMADGMEQMIADRLARTREVAVVAPERVREAQARGAPPGRRDHSLSALRAIGRRVGATWVVSGGITRGDTLIVLDVNVHEVSTGKLVKLSAVSGPDVIRVADAAAARVLDAAGATSGGPHLAEVETANVEAYEHFVRGQRALDEDSFGEAARQLDAALALDSGFVSALVARTRVAVAYGEIELLPRLTAAFQRYAHRATEWDRRELDLNIAFQEGDHARSEALARELVARFPRDPRAYRLLRNVLMSHGRWAEAEQPAVAQLALDSSGTATAGGACVPCDAYLGVAAARRKRGDAHGAERALRRLLSIEPDQASAWDSLAYLLAAEGRRVEAIAAARRAVTLARPNDIYAPWQFAILMVMTRRLDVGDSLVRAWSSDTSSLAQLYALDLRTILHRERGELRAALQAYDTIAARDPAFRPLLALVRANTMARLGDYDAARRYFERVAHSPEAAPVWYQPLGTADVRAGDYATRFALYHVQEADAIAEGTDTTYLAALADSVATIGRRSYNGRDWRLHHHIRGLIALRGRRYAEAAGEFEAARWGAVGWPRPLVEAAEAELARGRPAAAVAALRHAYEQGPEHSGRYLPQSEIDYRMALAFRAAGDADSAAAYGAAVRRAWRTADPEVRRLLARLEAP